MAEYSNTPLQTVDDGSNILFAESPFPCTKGFVYHREGSGVFRLRGVTNQCRALYKVWFGANIAIPTGGTVGEISVALTLDGEPLGASEAIVTPAAVEEFFNASVAAIIPIDRGCCSVIAVENTSDQPIDVQNANIIIERIA